MSRLLRRLLCAATALVSASAGAQLLGVRALPPLALPPPAGNLPVAGPLLQNILSQPGARQAISPTLDSVGGLTEGIASSGGQGLLELRRLRLEELIRTNRATVESDGKGLPVRRGIVAVLNPDPAGLASALRAGFRPASDQPDPALGLRARILAQAAWVRQHPGIHKVMHESKVGMPFKEVMFTRMTAAVQRCMDAGLAPRGDAVAVALDLRAAVIGTLSLRINEPDLPWPPFTEQADRFLTKLVGLAPVSRAGTDS